MPPLCACAVVRVRACACAVMAHPLPMVDRYLDMAEEASASREARMSIDMAAEELRRGLAELGRITGRVDLDEILDVIFSDFCIGK